MTRQDYEVIMGYFNGKKMDRIALEVTMDLYVHVTEEHSFSEMEKMNVAV